MSAYLLVVLMFRTRFFMFSVKLFTNRRLHFFIQFSVDFLWKLTSTARLKHCLCHITEFWFSTNRKFNHVKISLPNELCQLRYEHFLARIRFSDLVDIRQFSVSSVAHGAARVSGKI